MKNIWVLFRNDVKRLTANVVTGIIVLGLIFTPSIFSWYNIIACWDVFSNTGNLKVAVANLDDGYQSDLVPLKVNIGEDVVSALRANDQLDWEFTTEEDAVDGAESGKYYAAVVIPDSFSKDMMTFYSEDVDHAQIVYYTNEKKNAVAPKVTGQGADQVAAQVNKAFTETLTESALAIATSLSHYADNADASGQIGTLANHVGVMGTQMSQAADVLKTYSTVLQTSQNLVEGSAALLGQAREASDQVSAEASGAEGAAQSLSGAMSSSSQALSRALSASSASYAGLSSSIDSAFATSNTLAADSASELRDRATAARQQATAFESIVTQLQTLKGQVSTDQQATVQQMIDQMNASIKLQNDLADQLDAAADDIASGNTEAQAQHAEISSLASQAQQSVASLDADYETDIKPLMDQLTSEISALVDSIDGVAAQLDTAASDLQGSAGSVSGQLGSAKQQLDQAAVDLNASADKMAQLSQAITQALASGDTALLRQILASDPATLATTLAAPVQVDRHAVFPADNFGSQMAPLYTTLALWIGSLLLVVAIKVTVSEKAEEELDNPRDRHLFLGRFGVFAVMSLCQTTIMALGNMLFLGVQVSDPLLFMACFWLAGLVFTFIMYTMVVSFANLGKAIGVLLLILQVTGGGGSYPLQVLPDFFQWVSPYLPATHVINAMRAAMMGVYQNDFWIEMGQLMLFVIPFALLGLLLRKPLIRFLNWYVGKVEDSKLVA